MKAFITFFTSRTTLIALAIGIVAGALYLLVPEASWGSGIVGLIAFIAALILINRKMQSKYMAPLTDAQAIMQEASNKIQKKVADFNQRPSGSEFAMRKNMESIQKQATDKAFERLNDAEEFYKWMPMLEMQVNTLRFQLHFQNQEFEEADKLMDNINSFDPMALTLKMTRLFKLNPIKKEKGAAEFEKGIIENWPVTKTFKTAISRTRSNEMKAFVANVYAWMLVQKGAGENALKMLQETKKDFKKSIDPILLANIEHLQNRQASKVSCREYGEQWYSLALQQPPKQKPQQVRQRQGKGGRPF